MILEWIIKDENGLNKVAEMVADKCKDQCFLGLIGDLGSGKTTFVRSLAKIWNINNVKSPSFDIVHVHSGERTFIHIDAYRLKKLDLSTFNFDDLCVPPFCVAIEWPNIFLDKIKFNLKLYFDILKNCNRSLRLEFND